MKNPFPFKDDMPICKCDCHIKGVRVLHPFPCCNLTYQKYINADGEVDTVAYRQAIRKVSEVTYKKPVE